MDTALYPAIARRPDAAASASGPSPVPGVQTVSVVAVYRLSESGRKASLLAGGNGRERQQVALDVPVTRLHLVHVDPNGSARLKLKPRFELRAESQRVVRVEESPQYDAPPPTERLLQDAARNHQLEATYQAQGVSQRSTRLETSRTWRDEVAVAFLSDASRRAITHPSPTPRRCVLPTDRGRMDFDAKRDRGAARDVPLEAYRRFQADLRARRERAQDDVATFHAVHAEKQRLVREWTTEHGTDDQRARLAAGVLPLEEAVEAMTAQAFTAVAHLPTYRRDGAARLQGHLRAVPTYADAVLASGALAVATRYLPSGAYLGDRDMFLFLIDGNRSLDDPTDPSRAGMFRGFILRNSDVGAAALTLDLFLFRAVCGNHIIWGFHHLAGFRRRHVGASIHEAWAGSLESVRASLDASLDDDRALLLRATTQELGASREDVLDTVAARLDLSRKVADEAYGLAESSEPNPRSIWGYVQGLTRLSQRTPWQDARFGLDQAASRLLATVS